MKRILFIFLILFVINFGVFKIITKSNSSIPPKSDIVEIYNDNGKESALEKLEGVSQENLIEAWGKPDGSLFGMYGDIWEYENKIIIIYYKDVDEEVVIDVIVDNKQI
ncbi:hypothetical protein [Peptoniphilus mikwangii]|uniref:hypothetical protein n=1 Tax=Peptoniphilus mikwangii TaxID=1354300 RepID=UPI0004147065|nr:hypothetical protein [Peptoniphilus mikwangii]